MIEDGVLTSGGYRVEVHPEVICLRGEGGACEPVLFVSHPSLPGCCSDGRNLQEALANLADARAHMIRVMQEHGCPIPPPDVPPVTATAYCRDAGGVVQAVPVPMEIR